MSLTSQQCDYHMHSTASDGSLTPTELMAFAAEQGLKELALTDHDTFDGLAEASLEADKQGMRLVPGMEFSCSWLGITIHLVALWPQGLTQAAHDLALAQRKARWSRAEQIIQRLAKTPVPLELDEVLKYSAGGVPGRPHFAEAMVAAGYVTNHSQAFRKWLGSGKLGDIKNHWKPLSEAVPWLSEAGAFVSLAHPQYYKLTRSKRRRLITAFAEAGGQAIEVVSGQQDPQQTQSLLGLAEELELKLTWGSDFHSPGIICPAPGRYAALPEACVPVSQIFNL
ncbi:PHP domain-containing protein [Marinospirillum insulare]|uniref:Phosphatase n=1 Tax=Marinospirillum insulare TaxID=217169 RepID=A0ABQ5ZY75_9GAMM|nr:PHP domain-containing protein [Marinospirillum insulare]GLR63616.1 phosphatase [Marinospirillum insulare]